MQLSRLVPWTDQKICTFLLGQAYVCRALCKPHSVKTCEWLAHTHEIDDQHLPKFPGTDGLPTPPSELDKDETKEISKCGTPHNWQQQICPQNFDITKKTVPEFIDFSKCLESLESTTESKSNNESLCQRHLMMRSKDTTATMVRN